MSSKEKIESAIALEEQRSELLILALKSINTAIRNLENRIQVLEEGKD